MNESSLIELLGGTTLILLAVLAWIYVRLQDKNEKGLDRVVGGLDNVVTAITDFKLEVHERLSEHETDIALLKQCGGEERRISAVEKFRKRN